MEPYLTHALQSKPLQQFLKLCNFRRAGLLQLNTLRKQPTLSPRTSQSYRLYRLGQRQWVWLVLFRLYLSVSICLSVSLSLHRSIATGLSVAVSFALSSNLSLLSALPLCLCVCMHVLDARSDLCIYVHMQAHLFAVISTTNHMTYTTTACQRPAAARPGS